MIKNVDILKPDKPKRVTSGNKLIDWVEKEYEAGNLPFGSDDRDMLIAGIKENPTVYTKARIQEYINSGKEVIG